MPHYFFTLIYSLVVIFCAWLAKKFISDEIISGFADRLKIQAYVVNPVKKFFAVIPNSKVYSGIIKNYTNYNCGRLEVAVGVDYESNLNKVQKAINQALSREDMPILKDPEPIVAIDTLGGSSVNFKVLFWYSYDLGIPWITLKGKIIQAILEEFGKQGITIPSSPITISSREDSTLPRI